ncbi:MAG: trimethylamine methyltransferase family protein [Candidatus Humimicrobiaceae bacterium]
MNKGFVRNFKPLEILTEENLEALHKATLDVLYETGIRFESEKALKLFEKNGCKVDFENKRVRFPQGLVEECLRKCPSSFRVKARDPKKDLILGGDTVYFASSPGMQTVALSNWEPRDPTRQEYYDGVKVLDALENHHMFCCYTPYFGFKGLSEVMKIPEGFAAQLRNSTTFPMSCWQKDSELFTIEMAQSVGMETLIQGMIASSPLTYYTDTIDCTYRVLEAGFPIGIDSGPMFGATSPATTAGSLVSCNAELIAGVVFVQLVKPGTRVFISGFPWPMNMRDGSPSFGSIQGSLFTVARSQIWRKYNIPHRSTAACYTSSKIIDVQSGYERSMPAILAALSGASLIHLHGGIYGELAHHPVQSILDDDIAGMIGRFIEGVEVNNDTIALDLINKVGPIPGTFIHEQHTRKWWNLEQFMPKAADNLTYPEWMEKGKKSAIDYAKKRMEEILATHVPVPLTDQQEGEIKRILVKAEKYFKDKDLV